MPKKDEVLTVHEWEAIIKGRAIPANLFVGESTGQYVHRKIGRLIDKCDSLQRNLDECNEALEGAI